MQEKALLIEANDVLDDAVKQIGQQDWNRPSPTTPGWQLSQLVNHLAQTNRMIVDTLRSQPPTDESAGLDNADPLGNWEASMTYLSDELAGFGDYDKLVTAMGNDVPAHAFMHMIMGDRLAHSWDIAQALGVADDLPEHLVQAAYDAWLPEAADLPRGDGLGEMVELPDGASVHDKFLALTGRDPR